jgi:hypothetical protein
MKLSGDWIAGFVDGEGCFHVAVNTHPEMTTGFQVLPEFTVVQHQRDIQLLHALKDHFGCGVVRSNHGDRMAYRVRKLEDLETKIVPFFRKHSLRSRKKFDFDKFVEILALMKVGVHLTGDGIEEIRSITRKMNRGASR